MFRGYHLADVNCLMDKLGAEGRSTYFYLELFGDLPFIIFYVITFTILIVRLLIKNKIETTVLFYIALFPLIAGIFDFLEDISVINMLIAYPIIENKAVFLSSSATVLKGIFLVFALLSMFVNSFLLLYKKIK